MLAMDAAYTLSNVIYRLEELLTPKPESDPTDGNQYNPNIPYSLPLFIKGLEEAGSLVKDRTFLDVGCGSGIKLLLMDKLGFMTAGIERVPEYAIAAKTISPLSAIYLTDAREFTKWPEYALIFCWKPLRDLEDSRKLWQQIRDGMNADAVLFAPYLTGVSGLKPVGKDLYQRA